MILAMRPQGSLGGAGLLQAEFRLQSSAHAVEDADLPEIVLVASKLANDFDEEAGFHLSLHPLEL